jgi:AraC family transcriptional regulator
VARRLPFRTHLRSTLERRHLPRPPPGDPAQPRHPDFLCLAIEPEFLRRAAHDISHLDELQLAYRPINEDPLIRGLALALKGELEAGCPGGRWYGESLASALAVHLVRRYSTAATAPGLLATSAPTQVGGLSRNRLREAIEYIHEHLAQEIRLDDLARATELSPYHFARLFKRSTGLAPHQYLIRRRVERARELLVTSSLPISEVAIQSGFCDQSHLTTHFKRVYGVTPRVFTQEFARRQKVG